MEKKCTKCEIIKPRDDFGKDKTKKDGLNYWCKSCVKEYYKANREEHLVRTSEYIKANKEKHRALVKRWCENNKEKHDKIKQAYIEKNPNYYKDYYRANKEERYNYRRKQYHENPTYRLKIKFKDRLSKALKKNHKKGKTVELLGCTIQEYKLYLESLFKPEMNWENHGSVWEIDHIKPVSSFDLNLKEDQLKCFHYSNTQPLFTTTEIARSFGYINEIGNRNKSNMEEGH